MCEEVLQLIKKMDTRNVETQLALQCAPLIAGLKISNLFIVEHDQMQSVHQILHGSGLSYYALCVTVERATILVYDRKRVEGYLTIRRVTHALEKFGYDSISLNKVLPMLRMRYRQYVLEGREFPHELGLLLGYPVEDVEGFISDRGEKPLCTGYWKVYQNPQVKLKLFEQFERAQETLVRMVLDGTCMREIIAHYREKKFLVNHVSS